jgi:OOP family OmpA-OmpF porin
LEVAWRKRRAASEKQGILDMNRRLLAGTAGAVLLGLAGPAMADPDGWYGAVDLGYHWQGDFVLESENNAPDNAPYQFDFATDPDWAGFARLGYRFSPNWRAELEGGYRPGDLVSALSPEPRTPPTSVALCTPGCGRASPPRPAARRTARSISGA